MAFNVSSFREKFKGDGARPNLFYVNITDLTDFWAGSSGFEYFCRASQIPGMTQGVVPINYMGRQVKFAGNKTYADWTVTVLNDENFSYRAQFEAWMNGINGASGNTRTGTGNSLAYTTDIVVNQLSKAGATDPADNYLRQYTLMSAFPTDLSPITLDWGDNDTIEEYTVTFSFDYFTVTQGQKPLVPSNADSVASPNIA